jgi:cellobiose-specific phosphotransferase system component IIB
MKFNLFSTIKRALTTVVGSLLAVTLLFQAAYFSMAGNAIAADLNSSVLLTTNAAKMAEQVQGQLDLEEKGTIDKKNTQFGAQAHGTQKIDPDRSSQDIDLVKPTVEYTNKDMSNKLNETEKLGKGAGIKAAEKGGNLLDNVKGVFDKK